MLEHIGALPTGGQLSLKAPSEGAAEADARSRVQQRELSACSACSKSHVVVLLLATWRAVTAGNKAFSLEARLGATRHALPGSC